MKNIYNYPENISEEIFEEIIQGNTFKMERIVSPYLPKGDSKWYNQEENEYVVILQGEAKIELVNSEVITLNKGDHFLIKRFTKHRVAYTSKNPLVIWLTIHYK